MAGWHDNNFLANQRFSEGGQSHSSPVITTAAGHSVQPAISRNYKYSLWAFTLARFWVAGVTVRITCNNVLCYFQISKVNRCRGKSSYRRIIFFTFFTFAKLIVNFKGCNKSKSNEMFRGKPFENELGSIQKQSFNKFSLLWGEAQLCLPYDCL